MLISVAVRKSLYAIAIYDSSKCILHFTGKIKDKNVLADKYRRSIYAIRQAIRKSRSYIEENLTDDIITFEISNSTIIKWFDNSYSTERYIEDFSVLYEELNQIPIRYCFVNNKEPKATIFLSEADIEGNSLSGVDVLLSMEE